jgi:hypothetical protein
MPGWFKGMEIIMGYGQKRGSMLNARDLNVLPRRPIAVAAASFSRNPILLHRNHTSKN